MKRILGRNSSKQCRIEYSDKVYNYDNVLAWLFFEALKTNDYRYMVILDDYTELPEVSESKKAWLKSVFDDIFDVYLESEDSRAYKQRLTTMRRILRLKNNYDIIQNCISILWHQYSEQAHRTIEGLGYKFDVTRYYQSLTEISKRSKNIITQIEIAEKEVNKKPGKSMSFDEINDIIEEVRKYSIDFYKLTLKEWIIKKNRTIKKIKHGSKSNSRKK